MPKGTDQRGALLLILQSIRTIKPKPARTTNKYMIEWFLLRFVGKSPADRLYVKIDSAVEAAHKRIFLCSPIVPIKVSDCNHLLNPRVFVNYQFHGPNIRYLVKY
jgi:hypothetical protein